MTNRTKGFTLVELLVVVAIIALLVSILMPTLNKAKEQVRRVICASNLRGCGIAAHLYAADNDGFFPPHFSYDWGWMPNLFYYEDEWDLREYLRPYINFGLWKCPALSAAATIDDSRNTRSACYGTYQYYPTRRWPQFAKPGTEQYTDPQSSPDRRGAVDVAARQVMMQDIYEDDYETGDTIFNHGKGKLFRWAGVDADENPSHLCKLGSYDDGDGVNLLFYDSHAEWVGCYGLEPVGSVSGYHPLAIIQSRLP